MTGISSLWQNYCSRVLGCASLCRKRRARRAAVAPGCLGRQGHPDQGRPSLRVPQTSLYSEWGVGLSMGAEREATWPSPATRNRCGLESWAVTSGSSATAHFKGLSSQVCTSKGSPSSGKHAKSPTNGACATRCCVCWPFWKPTQPRTEGVGSSRKPGAGPHAGGGGGCELS